MPAVGLSEFTGRLQVRGDQCGVLVDRFQLTAFDRGGQPPVQLRAVGFELRFVGHSADQRMAECVFGTRREPDLVDQFGLDQLVEARFDPQHGQQVDAETGADD